jgi:hypothetical protein
MEVPSSANDYVFQDGQRSMAWKAEQVTGVVQEFVDVTVTAEDRRRTLVETDEVDGEQSQKQRSGQPQRRSRRSQIDGAGPYDSIRMCHNGSSPVHLRSRCRDPIELTKMARP